MKKKSKKEVEEVKEAVEETVPVEPEAPVEEPKKEGKYQANVDINPKIRKGDTVPEEMVNAWKASGIDTKPLIG